MPSNLQYIAKKVGETIYVNGNQVNVYEVFSTLNGDCNVLVGALETITQCITSQLNSVIVNKNYVMNITDVDNEYNFTWTSSSNLSKDLVVYTSSPAYLTTTNQESICDVSYNVSIGNLFDDLALNISWA
jgi:outer membrane lipoprotein-sorting protein